MGGFCCASLNFSALPFVYSRRHKLNLKDRKIYLKLTILGKDYNSPNIIKQVGKCFPALSKSISPVIKGSDDFFIPKYFFRCAYVKRGLTHSFKNYLLKVFGRTEGAEGGPRRFDELAEGSQLVQSITEFVKDNDGSRPDGVLQRVQHEFR